jgi:hypothetical protein
MHEMGLSKLGRGEAALRLARARAKEILDSNNDPLKHTKDFERLWIDAGYPKQLMLVGTLDDNVYIMSGNQSDDTIRKGIVEQLKNFLHDEV